MIDHGYFVVQHVGIDIIEVDAFLDDGFAVGVEGNG
jgi:hypothetical protein